MLRKTKLYLILALAFIMSIMSIPVALASPGNDEKKPSQAAINKSLQVPFGTKVPTATFQFEVTAFSVNSDVNNYHYDGNRSNVPLVNDPEFNSNANLKDGVGIIPVKFPAATYTSLERSGSKTNYYLESANLFTADMFDDAGIYTYKIKELPNTYSIKYGKHEAMLYSQAEYTMKVYVQKTESGQYEIAFIGVIKDKDDSNVITNSTEKLDPTPGGNPDLGYFYSQMIFTNKYVKTNGGVNPDDPGPGPGGLIDPNGPNDPDKPLDPGGHPLYPKDPDETTLIEPNVTTLEIKKKVDSRFGPVSTKIYFDFTLKIVPPDLVPNFQNATYRAYILEEDPAIPGKYSLVTDLDALKDNGNNSGKTYFEFSSLKDYTADFKLKHGQKLIFIDTPVGTSYTVTEYGYAGFTPDAEVVYNGSLPSTDVPGADDAALILPSQKDNTFNIDTDLMYVGENASSSTFRNFERSAVPTGLDLNDLPFIGLIALGIVALIVFVVVKSRKKSRQYTQ